MPGKMCYFETFNSFKVGGLQGLSDFEKENLAVYYFPYVGSGADMFVNQEEYGCIFPSIP